MHKPKNLIIDGQILQTPAWHRGMGRYLLQVLKELSSTQSDGLELSIIFNTGLECDAARLEMVAFLCPNIKQIQCELPTTSDKSATAQAYKAALEDCIAETFSGTNNYYLISALFYFDFFAEYPENCHKQVLFYDLTPLLFWKDLGGYFPPDLYMQRFERLLEAETILSISETTRRDLINTFGLDPTSIINIKGGFTKVAESTKKPTSFEVPTKYILFPTGDMPHKNNVVAIRGFEAYFRSNKHSLPLLVTSGMHDKSKEVLSAISQNIIFTDNVLDEELEWLYENASAVLFASRYEGLGMPILDAVAHKKPIITSRISVFEEMSEDAFYFFDPSDYETLACAIHEALQHKNFADKLKRYPDILKEYTWSNTCRAITASLDRPSVHGHDNNHKPLIAVACVHPGIAGQAGRISEALHAQLSKLFNIDYYFDANGYHYREMERPTFLDYFDRKSFDITKLTARTYKKYATIIYVLDPASFPSRVAQRAAVLPGIAVTDFGDFEFDQQAEFFKEIVLDNQHAVCRLGGHSFMPYQELVAKLKEEVAHINGRSARAERL